MKVVIEISNRRSAIRAARQQIQESNAGKTVDFRLFFESAQSLFRELNSTRLDLLNTLSKIGLCSVNELASSIQNDYSSVETDYGLYDTIVARGSSQGVMGKDFRNR